LPTAPRGFPRPRSTDRDAATAVAAMDWISALLSCVGVDWLVG
jgi:hypothetical protein